MRNNAVEAEKQFRRGWDYEHGNNIEKDFNCAINYYKKAADLGSELAVNRLRTLGIDYSEEKTSISFERKTTVVSRSMPKEILQKLQDQFQELQNSESNFYIVNAGRMNSGKSSLFNSLAKKKEMFPTKDVRTTIVKSEKKFTREIYFVDTPGLDAKEEDDKEAFSAYKKADLILFIHTPNIGEMHQSEIDSINKIAALFPDKDSFWQRFCLVFTFKEAMEEADFEKIKGKSLMDIKKHCGNKQFPIFIVSNDDYWRGIDEKEPELIEMSGINELKEFILQRTAELKTASQNLRNKKFEKLKSDALKKLEFERRKLDGSILKQKRKIDVQHEKLKSMHKTFMKEKKDFDDVKRKYENQINQLKNEIAEIEAQHNRDKSRYSNY